MSPTFSPAHSKHYAAEGALRSLAEIDPSFEPSRVAATLGREENRHLLDYVFEDVFTHVFPGDRPGYSPESFFSDLDRELRNAPAFHLWVDVPLCRYRCHFCQFPILVLQVKHGTAADEARRWVDVNIAEAKLWLDAVPALATTPVGEFCLFGGTPTAVPLDELERLVKFYFESFNLTGGTSLRAEGSPDSLRREQIVALRRLGFDTLTYGVQTFDDELLRLANRRHSGADATDAIRCAREEGFKRVDGDLVWGLPGQSVEGFLADVDRMIELDFSTIVIIKLHLRSFSEVDTAIGHVRKAVWEHPAVRARIAERGYRWPSLGEQFQMREAGVDKLIGSGYYEHPTTYFPKRAVGPGVWRSLNLDHDKQYPQVGIGLGGYTWSALSEANMASDPAEYLGRLGAGSLPFESITGLSTSGREIRAVRMALSTCQPLRDETHRARFPESSLFSEHWAETFGSLERRGLARIDRDERTIELTSEGKTLVEAIINTEIR